MRAPPVTTDVLDFDLLREIARQGGVRAYPANAVLINEGDTADSLFIVLSGRVKVYSNNADGKEIVIATHGAGGYVGELALDGGVRSASVMTLEPTTCSVVSGANLREFVAAHPDFASHLILKLIRSVRQATESVKSLALEDVYERVVRLLNDISDPAEGGKRNVRERLTQQDIADRVGASREMVSRIFKDLTAGGYLEVASGRIVIARKPPAAW
ncbi:MAG TPA: Crp/Fnr family transcriptional regulator [Caldimonas sp.]|jgi:CRP/FNR family cyclic AMP-dependent transcriptional regulator|nr:Crp/Fnr family transcriptional regulator [Caldimonas sp.]HEX4232674.1 Crp/Fnr family transcriptional regulator [Caldimonas sp.]